MMLRWFLVIAFLSMPIIANFKGFEVSWAEWTYVIIFVIGTEILFKLHDILEEIQSK